MAATEKETKTETMQVLIDRLTASGVIFFGLYVLAFVKIPENVLPFVTSVISAAAAFIFTAEVYNKKKGQ